MPNTEERTEIARVPGYIRQVSPGKFVQVIAVISKGNNLYNLEHDQELSFLEEGIDIREIPTRGLEIRSPYFDDARKYIEQLQDICRLANYDYVSHTPYDDNAIGGMYIANGVNGSTKITLLKPRLFLKLRTD